MKIDNPVVVILVKTKLLQFMDPNIALIMILALIAIAGVTINALAAIGKEIG